jgi:hypothetical protein
MSQGGSCLTKVACLHRTTGYKSEWLKAASFLHDIAVASSHHPRIQQGEASTMANNTSATYRT